MTKTKLVLSYKRDSSTVEVPRLAAGATYSLIQLLESNRREGCHGNDFQPMIVGRIKTSRGR